MCERSSVCILVLLGIPGTGKSTFSALFKNYAEPRNLNVVHVCYDKLVPLEEQAELKEQPGLWKQIRGEILNALEIKICQTLNKDCDLDDNEFIDKIDAFFIHNTCHSETLQTSESIKSDKSDKSDKINEKPSKTVFIIDDNNYLSSMRHEFYQVARKHCTGFAEIYFQSELTTALQLNTSRESRVPDSVIEKMFQSLEPPNPIKNPWEKFSFAVKVEKNKPVNSEMVESVVKTALRYPEIPLQDDSEEKEKDRIACSANLVHQADNQLRLLVNRRMTELRTKNLTKPELKEFSTQFYSVKQELLEDFRTGFTKLDRNLVAKVENRESGAIDLLQETLAELFNHKLSLNS
ncbi:L-seryl-tRNA(Sec) kinase [Eurytemora carolleeae]|uniref:L-seryl-tRNA(Sec) kinase n=1 Tax=Eurytemora carolleeae TaxID=1294199 RepID=UPI000C793E79|nr:L-seryl-tRNA(Sec) kinase [Eurytemora carolleeae]|eukprot:XP_023328266.1 L-seryl-tRNA(Sec) kinase-like [Eurytemora affinis]